jgi:hypothetical protein
MLDPIMVLKVDGPEIQSVGQVSWYNVVCQLSFGTMRIFYNMFSHIGGMRSAASTHLTLIRHVSMILSWGNASDQIENASPLFRVLSFLLMDCIVSLVCVTESGVPNSDIDQKTMTYDERYEMATL